VAGPVSDPQRHHDVAVFVVFAFGGAEWPGKLRGLQLELRFTRPICKFSRVVPQWECPAFSIVEMLGHRAGGWYLEITKCDLKIL
jgi:hypothetical protein